MNEQLKPSVRALSRLSGVPSATVHRFLTGQDVQLSTAAKLRPHIETCPCCGNTRSAEKKGTERNMTKFDEYGNYGENNPPLPDAASIPQSNGGRGMSDLHTALKALNKAAYEAILAGSDKTLYPDFYRVALRKLAYETDKLLETNAPEGDT